MIMTSFSDKNAAFQQGCISCPTHSRIAKTSRPHVRQTLTAIFRSFIDRTGASVTNEALVDGLRMMHTAAIEHLMKKTEPSVRRLVSRAGLPEVVVPDILHDAVVVLVKKIRDEAYDPTESAPATYLIGIAKKLISNQLKQRKSPPTLALDATVDIPDEQTRIFLEGRERRALLQSLLDNLGEPCAQLIRLKYLEGYRDEEILQQKMTHYNTAMALRSKRSKCFQRLVELATSTKSRNSTINEKTPQETRKNDLV